MQFLNNRQEPMATGSNVHVYKTHHLFSLKVFIVHYVYYPFIFEIKIHCWTKSVYKYHI